MNENRGPNPSKKVIQMLCVAAGGRCQFKGCNKKLFCDALEAKILNNSNIAHIIASSPEGPRGTEQSHQISAELDNIMLLCKDHHKLIDDFPETYTEAILKKMKFDQERLVSDLLDTMYYPKTEIVMLESKIKGCKEAHIDYGQAVKAVRKAGNNPMNMYGILLQINIQGNYKSPDYWKAAESGLEFNVMHNIEPLYKRYPDTILSVFPIAPIPLILKLGYILGDKRRINIYQKTRTPDTWEWLKEQATNSFETQKISCNSKSLKTALIISLTAEINIERVLRVYDAGIIYCIKAKRKGVDCISSEEDLKLFWQEYQKVCDLLKNIERCETIAVFPAVPVSAAFEMGRRYMPGIYPKMVIYDDDDGFVKTLTIGGESNVK